MWVPFTPMDELLEYGMKSLSFIRKNDTKGWVQYWNVYDIQIIGNWSVHLMASPNVTSGTLVWNT